MLLKLLVLIPDYLRWGLISVDFTSMFIHPASLMSSLAHTRAGIPDAMMTLGGIDLLINKLYSNNEQVRFACATALGYLTFNRTAARKLLVCCRNMPGLYDQIMDSIGNKPKICKDFTEEFRTAKLVGLPCLRWVKWVLDLWCSAGDQSISYHLLQVL